MRVIINDKRYGALKTLGERKQTFNEVSTLPFNLPNTSLDIMHISAYSYDCFQYLAQRKKQEAEEKRLKQKKAREDFLVMLQVCHIKC